MLRGSFPTPRGEAHPSLAVSFFQRRVLLSPALDKHSHRCSSESGQNSSEAGLLRAGRSTAFGTQVNMCKRRHPPPRPSCFWSAPANMCQAGVLGVTVSLACTFAIATQVLHRLAGVLASCRGRRGRQTKCRPLLDHSFDCGHIAELVLCVGLYSP